MHVVYLSHVSDVREGGERSLIELVRYFHGRGVRITLLSPRGDLPDTLAPLGIECVALPFLRLRRTRNPLMLGRFGTSFVRTVRALRAELRRIRPDVLHCNSATSALYGGIAAASTGVPVIWHMRDIQPHLATFRMVLPFIARRAARIIAISHAVADNLRSFGVEPSRIRVVHNAVTPPILKGGAELRRELGIETDDFVIAVIGKLIARKGQLTAVRAFARMVDARHGVRLVLAGGNLDSPYADLVRDEIGRLGLNRRVILAGYRQSGAVLDAANAVLISSEQEPFGRVVAEAMFARLPLVATRVGGIPELVRDGEEGLLVDSGEAEGMGAALRRVVTDAGLGERLSTGAHAAAQARFGWAQSGARVDAVYRELVG